MIYIGSDHAGFELKQAIKKHLDEKGEKSLDLGIFSVEPPADYPDIAREVSEKVIEHSGARGILVCGSGVGMCMTANKMKGIRAVVSESEQTTEMARRHNDANILCVGGRVIDAPLATKMVDLFIATPFEKEERHVRRVGKIEGGK